MDPSKSQPPPPSPFLQVMAVGDLTDVISERVCACIHIGFYSSTTPSTLQLDFFLTMSFKEQKILVDEIQFIKFSFIVCKTFSYVL